MLEKARAKDGQDEPLEIHVLNICCPKPQTARCDDCDKSVMLVTEA